MLLAVVGLLLVGVGSLAGYLREDVVYKGHASESVARSREDQLRESLVMARGAGWLGSGFGIAASSGSPHSEPPTFGLGREVGNSYLGAVEQLGWAGSVVVFLPVGWTIGAAWRCRRGTAFGPLEWSAALGAVAGLLFANGEAYLLASGSPLMVITWANAVLVTRLDGTRSANTGGALLASPSPR